MSKKSLSPQVEEMEKSILDSGPEESRSGSFPK